MSRDAEKPTAIKPIRPVERRHAFDDPEWIFEWIESRNPHYSQKEGGSELFEARWR